MPKPPKTVRAVTRRRWAAVPGETRGACPGRCAASRPWGPGSGAPGASRVWSQQQRTASGASGRGQARWAAAILASDWLLSRILTSDWVLQLGSEVRRRYGSQLSVAMGRYEQLDSGEELGWARWLGGVIVMCTNLVVVCTNTWRQSIKWFNNLSVFVSIKKIS